METVVVIFVILLLTGVFAGLTAGMLGIGGGIVIVPILFALMESMAAEGGHHMKIAVATSLSVIIVTGFSACAAQYKYGFINKTVLKVWGSGAFAGSIAGVFLTSMIPGYFLKMAFAILGIFISMRMFIITDIKQALPEEPAVKRNILLELAVSSAIGVSSTMVGIGGGVLSVPAMLFFGINIYHATATSSALSMLIAIPASIGFMIAGWDMPGLPEMSLGYVNLMMFVTISFTAVGSAKIGVLIAKNINQKMLRRVFAVVLFIASVKMLF